MVSSKVRMIKERIWRMLLVLVRGLSAQVRISSLMIPEWRMTIAILIFV